MQDTATCSTPKPRAGIALRPVFRCHGALRERQLKPRPFAATAFFFLAASDLVDDPGLEHAMAFSYGLQHRCLSVKKPNVV